MTRWCVVSAAVIGATLAGLLGIWFPWWVVLVAEVVVAGSSAFATFTLHERLTHAARVAATEATVRAFARQAAPRAFRALWDHPRLLLTWVDRDGRVLRQMGGALRLLPLPADGWTGRLLEADSEVARLLPQVLAGSTVPYDLEWTTPKGKRTHWVGVAAPTGGNRGRVDGALYAALLIDHEGAAHG